MSIPHEWRWGKTVNIGVSLRQMTIAYSYSLLLKGGKHGGWSLQVVTWIHFLLHLGIIWFTRMIQRRDGLDGIASHWTPSGMTIHLNWEWWLHLQCTACHFCREPIVWMIFVGWFHSFQWTKRSIKASWFLSMLECQLGFVGMLTLLPSYFCIAWILVLFLQINFLVSVPCLGGCCWEHVWKINSHIG